MKSATAPVIALLQTRSFVTCDLYTFTLAGGGVILLTTADRNVTIGTQTWSAAGPLADTSSSTSSRGSKATSHQKQGLDVDTWTFAVLPRALDVFSGAAYPDRIGGQPWLTAISAGALDGTVVQVDRAYWLVWPALNTPLGPPTGTVTALFYGRVADIDFDRGMATITLNSHLELLTQQMPRNLYGAACRWTLFGAGCGLTASSYAVGGAISSVTSNAIFSSSIAAPQGSKTYTLGRVVFTSGLNAGYSRMVRNWSAGVFSLLRELPFAATIGDAFTAYPGCDKQQATCRSFGNSINFGGQPNIPVAELSV